LYPTAEQAATLRRWSGAARFLWNLARDQRRWFPGRGIGKVRQCLDLTELRREVEWIADLPAQTGQQVLADLDVAWQRCWAGLADEPALKRRRNPVGLRFPQGFEARRLSKHWGAVRLPKLGEVRFRWTRELQGQIKNVVVSGSGDRWNIAFCLEVKAEVAEPNGGPPIGVDRGVAIAFALSDGQMLDREMWRPKERERLLRLERLKAVQQKGSNRWHRTSRAIAALHRRATDRRRDFAHKTSTYLAKNHGLVAIEALAVPNMTASASGTVEAPGKNVAAKSGLNRAILDKGWGLVSGQLRYKCPWYGSTLVEVPARNSSLECPACGLIDPANRPTRAVFLCVGCGHQDHADTKAAITICERGIRLAPAGRHPVAGRKASKRLRTWRQPAQEAVA
jgi:transposase